MDRIEQLLVNNEEYAAAFELGGLPSAPALRLAIVACMDARLDPVRVLGLAEGDAHVIRNAGGVLTDDVIRSLSVSQHLLGTEEIVFLHHTDCGLQKFTDEEFAAARERETGRRPPWPAGTFTDVEEDVRDCIRRARESPFLPRRDRIRGFVYEVETGRVREVR